MDKNSQPYEKKNRGSYHQIQVLTVLPHQLLSFQVQTSFVPKTTFHFPASLYFLLLHATAHYEALTHLGAFVTTVLNTINNLNVIYPSQEK